MMKVKITKIKGNSEMSYSFKNFKNLFQAITDTDDMRVVVGQDEILRELSRYER